MTWIFLVFLLHPLQAQTSRPAQASTCVRCHGESGISTNDLWPNLAGQKEQYLVMQLKAFREGSRYNQLMTPIAKMLSDKDIRELASYFSKIKETH